MSDSDSGWQRPKRRKTKEERLMAALKAVMRDGSSSRRSSRGRSRNRSRNKQKGSKGPRSRTRDQTPAKQEKKTKPYTRPPILRAAPTNNEWQCANCGQTNWMTRKECRQCHKMPPGPSNPVPPKEAAAGSTGHPHTTWADVAKGKSDQGSDKTAHQAGKASPSPEVPVKDGDTNTQDSQVAHYERAIAALPEGCSLRDNLKAQMMALKVTLPPETRPGVRVDQATARLTRAQKLKAELEEKLLEVEQAVQDNLTEIAAATAELENAKRALIPSAPTTDPGSACITFSREQSAELQGFLLSCQKSMATDPEEKERAKRRCNESHEAAGVTEEAAQEVDTAHKLHPPLLLLPRHSPHLRPHQTEVSMPP